MSANEELIVTSLNEIIETSSYVGFELKPYAVNAVSLFLMDLNAGDTIDQANYSLAVNKLDADCLTTFETRGREPATGRIQALTPKDSSADDHALPAADSGPTLPD